MAATKVMHRALLRGMAALTAAGATVAMASEELRAMRRWDARRVIVSRDPS
jgi:hypothetical protein